MLRTKQQVVQEILYEVYGGIPGNATSISENFVLRKLNNRIAEAAVKSAFSTYNLDGIVAADDIFTISFTAIPLLQESNTGLCYFALPAQPVGLPSNRAYNVYPVKSRGGVMSDMFKPISRAEATNVSRLPGMKKIFYYVTNGNMYFVDNYNLIQTHQAVNLDIVSAGASNLNDNLNLPDDMIAGIKTLIVQECKQMMTLADSNQIPVQDSPQPR